MMKQEEYNIKFCTNAITDHNWFFFDTSNAHNQYKSLGFINNLHKLEIEILLEDINKIRNAQLYDPDFLTSSEVYQVYNVTFSNPTFFVDGYPTIDIDDLEILLREWLDFIEVNSPAVANSDATHVEPPAAVESRSNFFHFIKKIFR